MYLTRQATAKALPVLLLLLLIGCSGSPAAAPTQPAPTSLPAPSVAPIQPSPTTGPSAIAASAQSPVAASPQALASTGTPKGGPTRISVGFSEIYEGQIPLWVAQDAGIFTRNGLDVDLQYAASASAISALLSDQIQISNGGGSEALSADANGADLVVVAATVPVQPYVFEVASDITSVDQLKGQKVGVSSPGSSSDIATRIGLKRVGLDPDHDVIIVAMGSSQNRTAALLSGSIQGGLDQPPTSFAVEAKGLHPLFSLAELKLPTVNNAVVVRRSYLSSQRDVVQRYVDSIIQAVAWASKNKTLTIPIMQKYLQVDDQDALSKTYDYALGNLFPALPYIKPEQFADSIETLSAKNDRVRAVDIKTLMDNSFVQSAADRGLDK